MMTALDPATMTVADNVRLAWRMVDAIKADPEHHDQNVWIRHDSDGDGGQWGGTDEFFDLQKFRTECGTVACAAGWTVLLAGYSLNTRHEIRDPDGKPTSAGIEGLACDLLGLDYTASRQLFHHAHSVRAVEQTVQGIFGPRPEDM